jgi:hypothetical protein
VGGTGPADAATPCARASRVLGLLRHGGRAHGRFREEAREGPCGEQ